ncbi:MAG: hypothetical protein ACTSYA_11050 [Candidatus Kariarchaeaceae archaeon]
MKLKLHRKASIELEIKRIKELNLSGEDTFLLACDLIDGLIYLNQNVSSEFSLEDESDGK